ncbi:subgroup iiii aminotransferase [Holotrichia oblita]|uniref:Subgroup iiii aminotransferase n=1 Tax=Holotrichia oblita TaxID=644536 RepID=A0ACB9SLY1_HOLOL|nr:subgroup iiii aminotransferase [Holotrichia oblita]
MLFGKNFSDHMFLMNYDENKGWHDPRIIPYQTLSLAPSTMVFHYGQELFEGLKAYRTKNGEIQLFRPEKNIERMNNTSRRLCIPEIDPSDALQAIKEIVKTDSDWVPHEADHSLYIRPFIIATDPFIGVKPSSTYLFMIILSPVGSYYPEGINPVKIYVENEYVRAVKGGIGASKAGANYAASLKGQDKAKHLGYTQVLWLDGVERKYIDEVGTMNVFFVIDGVVKTPALEGSILPGVTRDSCIHILKSWGYKVEETRVALQEIIDASRNGKLNEAFGTGTAAVISPIGTLNNGGEEIIINNAEIGPIAKKLYDTITGIQYGEIKDEFGWTLTV